ncbi:MAG: molybdopterin-dependent oxidoreductase [Sphingomonadales bacterium]|nr:molybdopterin-dependent oxidoreductase [Sphingomonadales bacterium]
MRIVIIGLLLVLGLPGLIGQPARAQTAAPAAETMAPEGPVLLTVSGAGATDLHYDQALLDALPAGAFTTSTIWTEGRQHFEGVYLHDLLTRLGVSSGTLRLTASNDYAITIPVAEIRAGEALLAFRRNGAAMTLRDKGPLWLVYPYDSSDNFRNEVIYSRSIWQLDRIGVEP